MSKLGMPDEYDFKARWLPAALSLPPFLLFYHYWIRNQFGEFIGELAAFNIMGYAIVGIAAWYLLVQVNNRLFGRLIQKMVFANNITLPSTRLLLGGRHGLSADTVRDIARKMKHDFSVNLPFRTEQSATIEDRNRIFELTGYIKRKVGDDGTVKRHNIEYGFVRNVCGGAVGASVISALAAAFFHYIIPLHPAFQLAVIFLSAYVAIGLLAGLLIRHFGYAYARALLERYVTTT